MHLLLIGIPLAISIVPALAGETQRPQRSFEFRYQATLKDIPAGAKKVRVWVPLPKTDSHQEITNLKINGPGEAKIGEDTETANRMAYFEVLNPTGAPPSVSLTFTATRFENRVNLNGHAAALAAAPGDRFLAPDRLGMIDDEIKRLASTATAGKSEPLEQARGVYDAVIAHMNYDKSSPGWGHGDAKYACTAAKGNCTDFHALFMAMCRASGIPCKFAIGFPLPTDVKEGEIGGYHCWAYFFTSDHGWVPVDTSEADKHAEKKDYFFGAHDQNRIEFTEGRDLKLVPPQDGEPVNYFIYPYVEVDGKPFDGVDKTFSFRDIRSS